MQIKLQKLLQQVQAGQFDSADKKYVLLPKSIVEDLIKKLLATHKENRESK